MLRKNRFYYYYRLIKWRLLKDSSPIGASIKITQRCNLRCSHCSWEKKVKDNLTLSEWKTIVNGLYQRGVSVIAVEGGEPTLHPEVSEIVQYIRSKGVYCIVITNGTRNISLIEPDAFWISIDGMEESHDRIRGRGIFRNLMNTVMDNQGRNLIALTSLSKSNVNDIESLCDFFSPHLSGFMFNFTYPYAGISEETLDRAERRRVAHKILSLKEDYPKILNSASYLESVGRDKAVYPWLLITVTSEGKKIHGCMIRHMEQEDCSLCDMGCCMELSKAYELRPDTVHFWNRNFGLPRLV